MTTKKLYFRAIVTAEFFFDSAIGWTGIVKMFTDRAVREAEQAGYFVPKKPIVIFELPDPLSPWYGSQQLIVHTIARCWKVTPVEGECSHCSAVS